MAQRSAGSDQRIDDWPRIAHARVGLHSRGGRWKITRLLAAIRGVPTIRPFRRSTPIGESGGPARDASDLGPTARTPDRANPRIRRRGARNSVKAAISLRGIQPIDG